MRSVAALLDPVKPLLCQPIFVGLCASSLCALGLSILVNEAKRSPSQKEGNRPALNHSESMSGKKRALVNCAMSSSVVTVVVLAWTKSFIIAMPFSIFSFVITWVYMRNKGRRAAAAMLQIWPEVTDHLISAIHSGLSLSEALVGLSTRGPERIRPYIHTFRQELLSNGDFVSATERLKARLNSQGSDHILEAILLAKSLGGSQLLQIFRTLGDFLRQDLALRKEIEIKHGWIKNSAHLSSAAPWLLLLLLSSQPGTAQSFAQPGGIAILLIGVILTSVAYLWMGKLGQLPNPPRVFE